MSNSEKISLNEISFDVIFRRIIIVSIIILFLTFVPANDWKWRNGWIFFVTFTCTYIIQLVLLRKNNPEIISNRPLLPIKKTNEFLDHSNMKVREVSDLIVLSLSILLILSVFIISGFDHRNNWSEVNYTFEIIGLFGLIGSQIILYEVLVLNKFGFKTLDVQEHHKVIDSGPYSFVRHPMYSGFILMGFGVPLLLNSWYALMPSVLITIMLCTRVVFEEKMLKEELEG